MRIALITETFSTGVGRHVADLMEELSGRGHEVHLLYGQQRGDPALVRTVQAWPRVHVRSLAMRRAPHVRDVQSLWVLWRYLAAHGPFDVLHGHSSKGGAYARLMTLLLRGRCLYTPHALITLAPDLGLPARLVYSAAERMLARLTDTIVCCSADERAHAVALGLGARRCVVVPHGIRAFDAPSLNLRRRLELPRDVVLAGFIGRLESQKAPDLLVEAVGLLHARGVPVHFAIAGEGTLRAGLERRLDDLGARQSVTWLGPVDGRRLMSELDLLVMPSRYEGFPYVLLEALHCGVPVIATPVGGVVETNAGGTCGTVVPHNDAPALAQAIEQLAFDSARRSQMAQSARGHARCFSVAAMADRIEALYRAGPSALSIGT